MTTETLVKPANAKEQLLGKISEMRQKNQIAKQKDKIERLEAEFMDIFVVLSHKYFGLSVDEIRTFSVLEKEALYFLVSEQASKEALCLKIFFWGVPLLGWLAVLIWWTAGDLSPSLDFIRTKHGLEKMFGKDFYKSQISCKRLTRITIKETTKEEA